MKEKFKKTLEKIQFISPGQPWEEVMCFVMEDEAFKYITEADSKEVYGRHQREIVEKAKEEFQEMLFEHSELFYDLVELVFSFLFHDTIIQQSFRGSAGKTLLE